MGKYARDLDENLEKKVKQIAKEVGLIDCGISIEAIRLRKAKKNVGEIVQGNDLVKLFTGEENLIAIALYEDAFLLVDEKTQDIWIENLISQISYDDEKEKVIITKPELQIGIGMYHKYGNVAVQKAELALATIQSIEAAKKGKTSKKGKKNEEQEQE